LSLHLKKLSFVSKKCTFLEGEICSWSKSALYISAFLVILGAVLKKNAKDAFVIE
jgi:hypothetical protein